MNRAPVTVTTPSTTYEPARFTADDSTFQVTDCHGNVLASGTHEAMDERPRVVTFSTDDGRWEVRNLCGCGSRKRGLLRQWEECP